MADARGRTVSAHDSNHNGDGGALPIGAIYDVPTRPAPRPTETQRLLKRLERLERSAAENHADAAKVLSRDSDLVAALSDMRVHLHEVCAFVRAIDSLGSQASEGP